jgi:hypothetical protein
MKLPQGPIRWWETLLITAMVWLALVSLHAWTRFIAGPDWP